MNVFAFDPADYRQQYAEQGWVHIRNGIDPAFFERLRDFALGHFADHEVRGTAIGGTKSQALYEFPPEVDFPGHLFDVVSAVAGLERGTMTLSERHIKAYDADTPPDPPAHKDRLSSQCSVGLSIDIPKGSRLVLYPDVHRDTNLHNISPALRESLAPEELPENALKGVEGVEIHDEPGDVVMFPGSSMWHLRRDAARAVNLYLKFNDFDSDPLGEDPASPGRREATLAALRNGRFDDAIPVPARRLDTVTRQFTRDGWRELVQARVWDERPLTLSEADVELLRAADGRRAVAELGGEDAAGRIRRLAEHGVVDLLDAPLRP